MASFADRQRRSRAPRPHGHAGLPLRLRGQYSEDEGSAGGRHRRKTPHGGQEGGGLRQRRSVDATDDIHRSPSENDDASGVDYQGDLSPDKIAMRASFRISRHREPVADRLNDHIRKQDQLQQLEARLKAKAARDRQHSTPEINRPAKDPTAISEKVTISKRLSNWKRRNGRSRGRAENQENEELAKLQSKPVINPVGAYVTERQIAEGTVIQMCPSTSLVSAPDGGQAGVCVLKKMAAEEPIRRSSHAWPKILSERALSGMLYKAAVDQQHNLSSCGEHEDE